MSSRDNTYTYCGGPMGRLHDLMYDKYYWSKLNDKHLNQAVAIYEIYFTSTRHVYFLVFYEVIKRMC